MLAPKDITSRKFSKSTFGGYRSDDVDGYLSSLADDISLLISENNELKRKIEDLNIDLEKHQQNEEMLSTVLISAQKMADSTLREAKGKADLIIRDANIKAERVMRAAERDIERSQGEHKRVKAEVAKFKSSLLNIYRSHLELVTALPEDDNRKDEYLGASELTNKNILSPETMDRHEATDNLPDTELEPVAEKAELKQTPTYKREEPRREERPAPPKKEEEAYKTPPLAEVELIEKSQVIPPIEKKGRAESGVKGFVPSLDRSSAQHTMGNMFYNSDDIAKEIFKEESSHAKIEEIEQQSFFGDISPPEAYNKAEEEEDYYYEEENYDQEEEDKQSRFGELRFGQEYELKRDGNRNSKKKKSKKR